MHDAVLMTDSMWVEVNRQAYSHHAGVAITNTNTKTNNFISHRILKQNNISWKLLFDWPPGFVLYVHNAPVKLKPGRDPTGEPHDSDIGPSDHIEDSNNSNSFLHRSGTILTL